MEMGLKTGVLAPLQRSAMIRTLCTSIRAHTDYPSIDERTHIALLLVTKYPCLKGSFGAGHVSFDLSLVLFRIYQLLLLFMTLTRNQIKWQDSPFEE